jgi:hypothetical protein
MFTQFRMWRERRVLRARYWLIVKLIGRMPVAANLKISDYDFYNNFNEASAKNQPHMFWDNRIYNLERRIKREVFTGNKGIVKRVGNTFVLDSTGGGR